MDEIIAFRSQDQWEKWLAKNHSSSKGIWIRVFKRDAHVPSVSIAEALDVALCYGWITGQARPNDERSWLSRFVPRRPKSVWSKINTQHAERLIREGRMRPSGLKQIEEARRDGRWEMGDGRWDRAYSPPSSAKLPDDFVQELRKNKRASAFFKTPNKTNVYAIIFRLENTKRDERRRMKIKQMVEMFGREEKFH